MRLKQQQQAALGVALAQRSDRGRDLGRMVRVIVEHQHAAGFAVPLEPPRDAAKVRQRMRSGLRIKARGGDRCARRNRVCDIKFAGETELRGPPTALGRTHAVTGRERTAGGNLGTPVGRFAQPGGRNRDVGPLRSKPLRYLERRRRVRSHDQHTALDNSARVIEKRRLQLLDSAVVIEMIGFDIGNHGDSRRVMVKRAAVLIGLENQPGVRAARRVAGQIGGFAAQHIADIAPRGAGGDRQHRRGRGLAVRAADGDHLPPGRDLREQLGAGRNRYGGVDRRRDLGVRFSDGDGANHAIRPRNVPRIVPNADLRAALAQRLENRRVRPVAAADGQPVVEQDVRQGAHVNAADTDEVRMLQPYFRIAHGANSSSTRPIASAPSSRRSASTLSRIARS